MKPLRRKFLHLAAGAAALPVVSRISWAQAYPSRSVTMIVPFAAGGPSDAAARIIGEYLSHALGQQFVMENVGGAGGTTGSIRTMRANPDGYTIQMGHTGTHAVSVALYPNLPYKPDVDFEPIGLVVEQPLLIVARKDLPPNDLREFVGYLKANSEKLNMAHAGVGSNSFNYSLMLNATLDVKPTLVPFNGTAPAATALLGGQVDYMWATIVDVGQQVKARTLKAYVIGTTKRSAMLPEVPSSKEASLPDLDTPPWWALFAPKGTPRPVLDRLSDTLDKALDDHSVRNRLLELGGEIPDKARRGQQPLAILVKSEIARWTPIIKAANIKAQ